MSAEQAARARRGAHGVLLTPAERKDPNMWHHDPRLAEIRNRADETFTAWSKARSRVHRCTKPESLEKARAEEKVAEAAYRKMSADRDALVELVKAQWMQRHGKVAP